MFGLFLGVVLISGYEGMDVATKPMGWDQVSATVHLLQAKVQ